MSVDISVVLPCLNEEKTVGICVQKAITTLKNMPYTWEVIVVDNGSVDQSIEIATRAGARVVKQPLKGYGNAYLKGFSEALGQYIVMADSDDSYDLTDLERFIHPLVSGDADMVIGNRLHGNIEPQAMPWLHRYVGNPVLSWLVRLFFYTHVADSHCGMRSFTCEALERMKLCLPGMEFATEMVIKAANCKLRIVQIPITLHRDGREGTRPHLRTFQDGWRHLRLMLALCPRYLYFIPGILLFLGGIILQGVLFLGPTTIFNHTLQIHTSLLAIAFPITGMQILILGIFTNEITNERRFFLWGLFDKITIDHLVILGTFFSLAGLVIIAYIIGVWTSIDFGRLQQLKEIYKLSMAVTLLSVGLQIVFSSFIFHLLRMKIGFKSDSPEFSINQE